MSPNRLSVSLMLLMAGCGAGSEPALPAGSSASPDIILISVDTLRADHLSSYGHSRPTSPFFDRLAAEGTRYTFARSASPWTLPAHTSMLTGQLPVTHKVVDDGLVLDPSVPVLPELMQQAGYNTAGFVATMYVSTKFGFD
ncbi:MAG: sulfatase-like hydrolase/transferase, partial [Myxococcota bacterium]|nr:sulfatase-like hydrolase/transferase [Myxococcota bacterium]